MRIITCLVFVCDVLLFSMEMEMKTGKKGSEREMRETLPRTRTSSPFFTPPMLWKAPQLPDY
jgi:hypothetical protein